MKLLLLPGLDGTGTLFDRLIGCLPENLSAVAVAYPPSLGAFDDYVSFVSQYIVNVGESMVLVAESFSGPIAVEVLRNPPDNLKGVVLVATFMQSPSPRLLALAGRLPHWLMRALVGLALDSFCLNGNADDIAAKRIKDVVQSLSPELIKARLGILQSLPVDLPSLLTAGKLPLLFIKPLRDRLVARKYFSQIEQRLPGDCIASIDGPHFLLQCRPSQCADAIAAFIKRCV